MERHLKSKDSRILIIETSRDYAQIGATSTYQKNGNDQEEVIRYFWID